MHNLPLLFVGYSGIKEVFTYLCDYAISISRNTTRSDILKLHKREKAKLKLLLNETPSRIYLTYDLWTSVTTNGFICLTPHFVDKAWDLQKRVLSFSSMPPLHNGVWLSEKVYALISDSGIKSKLFSISLDNSFVNDKFVDFLKLQLNVRKTLINKGQFFHIRCNAHCGYIILPVKVRYTYVRVFVNFFL
ncbi:hypothetical protein PTKIN_Ptkin15bG0145800 [Pterospermum kingtungense]